MGEKIKKILRWILIAVFLVTVVLLIRQFIHRSGADASYEYALEIASAGQATAPTRGSILPQAPVEGEKDLVWAYAPAEDENARELWKIDLAALQEVNPDVVGWIYIPGTPVNYPVLQGENNQFYLKHTWEKKSYVVGSIFLECENSPDFTDFNTIIYGHNIQNGTMFATVTEYVDQSYADAHPYVYILNAQGVWRYQVFAAYKAPVKSKTYGLDYTQEEARQELLDLAAESSLIETGVTPATTDRIVTLSTCTGGDYSKRYVVLASLPLVQMEAQPAP